MLYRNARMLKYEYQRMKWILSCTHISLYSLSLFSYTSFQWGFFKTQNILINKNIFCNQNKSYQYCKPFRHYTTIGLHVSHLLLVLIFVVAMWFRVNKTIFSIIYSWQQYIILEIQIDFICQLRKLSKLFTDKKKSFDEKATYDVLRKAIL